MYSYKQKVNTKMSIEKTNAEREIIFKMAIEHIIKVINAGIDDENYTPFEGMLFITDLQKNENNVIGINPIYNDDEKLFVRFMARFNDIEFVIELYNDKTIINIDDVLKINELNQNIVNDLISENDRNYLYNIIPTIDLNTVI